LRLVLAAHVEQSRSQPSKSPVAEMAAMYAIVTRAADLGEAGLPDKADILP
jgi:hypothetical protein